MEVVLIVLAGVVIGFGTCAHLASGDTTRNSHAPARTGPKLRQKLARKYRAFSLAALCIIFVAVWVSNLTPETWMYAVGFVGAVIGAVAFNIADRRYFTKGVG